MLLLQEACGKFDLQRSVSRREPDAMPSSEKLLYGVCRFSDDLECDKLLDVLSCL